ncbi:MAG TPA: family 16 glycoside hydrolase [Bryobacteraceae bacterium]|nr:family 16 glycoside hydrolase [Bryobacteraceae bacterium]
MNSHPLTRRSFVAASIAAPLAVAAGGDQWIELFNGRSLENWRPSENKNSWKVVNGMLAADGPRSHLFYTGQVRGADFRNFELEVELTTKPECNSGIYFHTAYQETGFPEKGFEVQINNTARGDGGYLERKKTGSLYGLRNMYKQLVPDEVPFRVNISVRGKNVQIHLNGQLLVDYVEPTPPVIPAGGEKQRFLSHGTFALQCHNDGSKAAYRSVRVRPLPDNIPAYVGPPPLVDNVFREVINIGRHNVPMVDYHVFLRNGMTLEDALRKSRRDGIQYGLTVSASDLNGDAGAHRWLKPYAGRPVFCALQATNGDWTSTISQKTATQFDYILADGRRDSLNQIIKRLDIEPIDIYTYPTRLTLDPEAQRRLIDALVRNKVALELNTNDRLPGQAFIQKAKQAGCKFAFGTGNRTVAELKRCEYGLEMVAACQLDWHNFFAPGAWWPKAVDRRWPAAV